MEKKEIFELMDHFERSSIQSMKLTDGDFALELQKAQPTVQGSAAGQAVAAAAIAVSPAAEPDQPVDEVIKAPLVGTYYAAPSPDAEPFVQVGSRLSKGETVCLIEAMKTMSEIPAPCDLVVEAILVNDGALVAYDAPILRYRHV